MQVLEHEKSCLKIQYGNVNSVENLLGSSTERLLNSQCRTRVIFNFTFHGLNVDKIYEELPHYS